jgi:hypothetical protein
MELTSVTLDEVFAAAQARAASLVPETSGYLALAVADASARLPYLLEDPMVMLTSEGTVKVSRGTQVVPPEESATRMRDLLARLLDCSAGSMPALAATAKARAESADGVETFIRELEAALVPVNRAAARRALARLARETVRAKDSGRLRRRKRQRANQQPPCAPPAPEPPRASAPIAAPPFAEAPIDAIEVEVELTPHDPAPIAIAVQAPEPTPIPEEPPTVIDAEVAPVVLAPAPAPVTAKERSSKSAVASLGSTCKSDVDDLLERFVVSTLSSPESMREARASLKRLAGLDPTPPPPAAAEIRRLTEALESVARAKREAPPPDLPPAKPQRSGFRTGMVAIAVIALLAAGLLGHYLPRLLAAATPPDHALTSTPSR